MEPPSLIDLIDQWLASHKLFKQYRVAQHPLNWGGKSDLRLIECQICWYNMGWVSSNRIFSNDVILEATNPSFFDILKQLLIKHTKKCKIQK